MPHPGPPLGGSSRAPAASPRRAPARAAMGTGGRHCTGRPAEPSAALEGRNAVLAEARLHPCRTPRPALPVPLPCRAFLRIAPVRRGRRGPAAARIRPRRARRRARACGGRPAPPAGVGPFLSLHSQAWRGRDAMAGSWAARSCLRRRIAAVRRPDPRGGPLLRVPPAPPPAPRSRIARRMNIVGPRWRLPACSERGRGKPSSHINAQVTGEGGSGESGLEAAPLARWSARSAPPAPGQHLDTGGGAAA